MLQIIDGATGEGTVRIRPLRRAEYLHLARGGAFDDEEIELVHGALVEVGTAEPWHDRVVAEAAARLRSQVAVAGRGRVLVQTPLPLSDYSVPRPDLVVTDAASHWAGGGGRALLVVEVAGASLAKDRGPKRLLYGHAPIDEYWIVDLEAGCIEVFGDRDPALGLWASAGVRRRGDTAQHRGHPHLCLAIDDLIPLPWMRGPSPPMALEVPGP